MRGAVTCVNNTEWNKNNIGMVYRVKLVPQATDTEAVLILLPLCVGSGKLMAGVFWNLALS